MTNIIDGSWSAMPRMIIPEALGNGIDIKQGDFP
jgi:hypothetical protein